MREALIDALAETLTEVQADTLGDASTEGLLYALEDTIGEVEAETIYKTLKHIKAVKLVDALHDRLGKDKSGNSRRHTAGCFG